jgi:Trk-type K+ transport system membrane component
MLPCSKNNNCHLSFHFGFLNAGFSILPNGLANPVVNTNYIFQITIAVLIILGGIGFPVLLLIYNSIKKKTRILSAPIQEEERTQGFPVCSRALVSS